LEGPREAPEGAPGSLLIITNDVIGERMAGPAIRTWELARVLSRHLQVDLAVPPFVDQGEPVPQPHFPVRLHVCRKEKELRGLVGRADILMTLGAVTLVYPFLTQRSRPLIMDAYDPFLLAGLELYRTSNFEGQLTAQEHYRRAHISALRAADLILCASERQRDYWLGMMSVLGRVNPYTYRDDPTLSRLLRIVPFGLPSEPPRKTRRVLKGIHAGIQEHDRVVLWGGGIWDWLDADTAIRAMAVIAETRRDIKLFFMGTKRPNATVARMTAVDGAIELSRRLGLLDRFVFFNEWVPYADRQDFLLESDVGISLHRDVLETRFAFRTRLLDYLWAGLPIVATEGDSLSRQMEAEGLGRSVLPGDEAMVAAAILDLLEKPNLKTTLRPRFERIRATYEWEAVAAPLVEFCKSPRLSPDKAHLRRLSVNLEPSLWRMSSWIQAARALVRGR
jgi:glycosyltransferase involved in cell wall biosynthesis